jgi:hypothetical protein
VPGTGRWARALRRIAAAVFRRRVAGREAQRGRLVPALVELVDVPVYEFVELGAEVLRRVRERDAVLRALRAGERRLHVTEVELERVRVDGLLRVLVVEEALLLAVGLDELQALLGPARELEVAERLDVDREDRARGAHLGGHVPDRRPVGEREVRQPGPPELDELPHHAPLAQHLRDGQDEVGGGGALRQLAGELEAHHLRNQHRDRLAEHGRLRLDSAHAPAQHAEPVDHRRV